MGGSGRLVSVSDGLLMGDTDGDPELVGERIGDGVEVAGGLGVSVAVDRSVGTGEAGGDGVGAIGVSIVAGATLPVAVGDIAAGS